MNAYIRTAKKPYFFVHEIRGMCFVTFVGEHSAAGHALPFRINDSATLERWRRMLEKWTGLRLEIVSRISPPQPEAVQPPKGNAMSVRMKVQCRHIQSMQGGSIITLEPVTGGSPENDKFFKATPYGRIEIGTVNEDATSRFGVGREYFVDFTPAHAVEPGQAFAETQPLAGVSPKPVPGDNVDMPDEIVPHPSTWVEGGKKDGG